MQARGLQVGRACWLSSFDNNSNFNANDRNVDNQNALRGIAQRLRLFVMDCRRNLWQELCSYDNLVLAFNKARKHKTKKDYVRRFENNLQDNLQLLRSELLLHSYQPKPLVNFVIRDPKTRKISKSDFRDRVVHHALCNIIEPIFEKGFIYDSYANRIGKGTQKAIERFDEFKRKASRNNTRTCYALKADIRKYFESVNHKVLIRTIEMRIEDRRILWLTRKIIANQPYPTEGKGMPLGNLTSQFFANVYLNELDQFAKHKLKVKHYIRYVDDIVILSNDKHLLRIYKNQIERFLKENLLIELHPDKSRIIRLGERLNFLGVRVYYHHKLLKKQNIGKMKSQMTFLKHKFCQSIETYDKIYDTMEGWIAYAKNADTYNLRRSIMTDLEHEFLGELSTKEINRLSKLTSSNVCTQIVIAPTQPASQAQACCH
ncbi:MAG: reverse transcriptase/maturase family protein [Candidatus Woesearchaeota archaeon]